MIPPRIKPPKPWQPGLIIGLNGGCFKPEHANEHFIVNSTRQTIMRALVSSRAASKKSK